MLCQKNVFLARCDPRVYDPDQRGRTRGLGEFVNDLSAELAIAVAGIAVAFVLLWPKVANARSWRAAVTPLASIIGSGFLVLGPVLVDSFGSWAVLSMLLLCLTAYAFGSAIRFNIVRLDQEFDTSETIILGERVASWVLALAYFISVAYYLNLFGAFLARLFGPAEGDLKRMIATATYLVILIAGLTRGFGLLERLEQVSVSLKLAIIAALLAGLTVYTSGRFTAGDIVGSGVTVSGFAALQMMFGLIVTVQGFETSRYLGDQYEADERIRSMKLAQAVSTIIYLGYVALLSLSFSSGSFQLTETAIIDLMVGISAILAPLLIIAALAAQFSAAVADTVGSGGLVHELTHGKVNDRKAYLAIAAVGIGLTWIADIFAIISFASRAFALYYAIQAGLACLRVIAAGGLTDWRQKSRLLSFGALAVLGIAACMLGIPVEAG